MTHSQSFTAELHGIPHQASQDLLGDIKEFSFFLPSQQKRQGRREPWPLKECKSHNYFLVLSRALYDWYIVEAP